MDCEIFDRLVIDRVFAELDDLTSGAVQRHVAHCSRCRSIESGLRATREVAVLTALEPPPDFIENVLALERSTRTRLPMRQRLERTVSVLAGWAMRPQLTMGALLLLMIGSSLFLLRARPSDREVVHVTERGVPEGEVDIPTTASLRLATSSTAPTPAPREALLKNEPTGSTPMASAVAVSGQLNQAKQAFSEGRYADAHELAESAIRGGSAETAEAALLSASALARDVGCASALARFEALRARHGRSTVGEEAAWNAAECHRALGRFDRARQLYEELRLSGTWGQRARGRLRNAQSVVAPAASSDEAGPVVP